MEATLQRSMEELQGRGWISALVSINLSTSKHNFIMDLINNKVNIYCLVVTQARSFALKLESMLINGVMR